MEYLISNYNNVFIPIPNWLFLKSENENYTPIIKNSNYGKEKVAIIIWLSSHRIYNRIDFRLCDMMQDYGIDTSRKHNNDKWINIIKQLIKNNFMILENPISKFTIKTRVKAIINEEYFNEDNVSDISLDNLDKIFNLSIDRIISICIYGLSEVLSNNNKKEISCKIFWNTSEELAKMINISRKTWETYTYILNKNTILINDTFFKGTAKHTIYGFNKNEIIEGIKYFKENVEVKTNSSKIEEKTKVYLEELKYKVNTEYECTLCPINSRTKQPLPFDNEIILENGKHLIIEVHGGQHYIVDGYYIKTEEELHKRKLYDRYKRIKCIQAGYEYLEIPYTAFDKKETYKKLINNKIKEILEK